MGGSFRHRYEKKCRHLLVTNNKKFSEKGYYDFFVQNVKYYVPMNHQISVIYFFLGNDVKAGRALFGQRL